MRTDCTVSDYLPGPIPRWRIQYDDGNEEDLTLDQVEAALALYERKGKITDVCWRKSEIEDDAMFINTADAETKPELREDETSTHGKKKPHFSKDFKKLKSLIWEYVTTIDPSTGEKWKSQRKFLQAHNVSKLQPTFQRKVLKLKIESHRAAYEPSTL